MATLQDLLAMAAARGRLFGVTMRYTELTDIAAGGSIGSAASTVDLYPFIAVNQTTASKLLTLPTPTNTSIGRSQFIANTGSTLFWMYGRVVHPGSSEEFLYVPSVGWRSMHRSKQVIASSAVQQSHTGDTNETTKGSVTIPGGALGANSVITLKGRFTFPASGNSQTIRLKADSSTLQTWIAGATQLSLAVNWEVQMRNALNSQLGWIQGAAGTGGSTAAATFTTATEDFASDTVLAVTVQLGSGAETIYI